MSRNSAVKEETRGAYDADALSLVPAAIEQLRKTLAQPGSALESPAAVRDYLRLQIAGEPHEVFATLFLDAKHRVLAFEVLFHGTIDGASVYPRQVVKRALHHNAAACILAHNHPSGVAEPSQADRTLTKRIKDALELVDVRVLDHMVIGGDQGMAVTSMAEMGFV